MEKKRGTAEITFSVQPGSTPRVKIRRRAMAGIVLGCGVLTSCVSTDSPLFGPTTYHPRDETGGYTESRIDARTFLVEFAGNGYTDVMTVQRYLFRRAAQLTVENQFTTFHFLSRDMASREQSHTAPLSCYGNRFSATCFGGETYDVSKPRTIAIIRMSKAGDPGAAELSLHAFQAKEVLEHTGDGGSKPLPAPPAGATGTPPAP